MRKERDLLQVRVEAAEAEVERERGLHRRELRRRAKDGQDVADELNQAKETIRELRLQVGGTLGRLGLKCKRLLGFV